MRGQMQKLRKKLTELNIEWHDDSDKYIQRTSFEFRGHHISVINGLGTYGNVAGALEMMIDNKDPLGYLSYMTVLNFMKSLEPVKRKTNEINVN